MPISIKYNEGKGLFQLQDEPSGSFNINGIFILNGFTITGEQLFSSSLTSVDSYLVVGTTGSSPNARQISSSFGNSIVDNGSGSTVEINVNTSSIPTLTAPNTFTDNNIFQNGLSGSLTQLADGTSYLVGRGIVTITSNSSGQIFISGTGDGGGGGEGSGGADNKATYVLISTTASLDNERSLSSSFGVDIVDNGAHGTVEININVLEIPVLTASNTFSGPNIFTDGISGSHTQLDDGSSFIVAGPRITIVSESNGSITISGDSGADAGASYVLIGNTASLANERALSSSFGNKIVDNGANGTVEVNVDETEIPVLSASNTFTGVNTFTGGITGSLTQLAGGGAYIRGEGAVTVSTGSSSEVIVSSTLIRTNESIKMHTGLIEGGVIPNVTGVATFDIMSGSGLVVNNHTDPLNPTYANITWANSSSIAIENIATATTSLIGFNISGGLEQRVIPGEYDLGPLRDLITLAVINHPDNSAILSITPLIIPAWEYGMVGPDFAVLQPNSIINGNNLGDIGSLQFSRTLGKVFSQGANYANTEATRKNTSIVTVPSASQQEFFYIFSDGGSGVDATVKLDTVDPTTFDDGSGTPATVPNNRATIQRVYIDINGNCLIQYGQVVYNSFEAALIAIDLENFSRFAPANFFPLAVFVLDKGASTLQEDKKAAIVEVGTGGSGGSSTIIISSDVDSSASFITVNNTGSLPNERSLSSSFGNRIIDNGANGTIEVNVDETEIPVLSASNIFTGQNVFSDISGTLMLNQAGNSYLVKGDGILIDSSSGDQVILSTDLENLSGSFADVEASYIVIGNTASLPNERALASGFGNTLVDEGADGDVKIDIDGSVIPVLSATNIFTGANTFSIISGTLMRNQAGNSYLVKGDGILVDSSSGDQIILSTDLENLSGTFADIGAAYIVIGNTASLPNERALTSSFGNQIVDGGAGSTVDVKIDETLIPTLTASNTFSGDNTYTGGNVFSDISGTLMLNQAGNSYIAQGDGVLVNSSSGDQVVISADLTYLNNNFADAEAFYVIIGNTSSLPNERALVGGFGNDLVDEGANGDVKIDIDGTIIPVLSATQTFTGANTFTGASVFSIISGTLMRNQAGNSYLVKGNGILIDSSSGDQVILSADLENLSGSFADVEASYIVIGNTSSLPNERALVSGFGNDVVDEGADGDVKIDIDGSIIPVLSATNIFTGANTFSIISGTLMLNQAGNSYLVKGNGILVDSSSGDQVVISTDLENLSGTFADVEASYIVIGNTSSLPNERALASGFGNTLVDEGADGDVKIDIDGSVIPVLSASNAFTGENIFSIISGTLMRNQAGNSYLVKGDGILVDSSSGDQIILSTDLENLSGTFADVEASYIVIGNTSSLPNERALVGGFGNNLIDEGADGDVKIDIDGTVIPVLSATQTFTGDNTFSGDNTYTGGNVFSDISGTLMLNAAGSSYLVKGNGILVDSSSGDHIILSADLENLSGSFADVEASYIVIGNTSSLPNERALVGGFGNTLIDEGADGDVKIDIDGTVIPVLSATQTFTGGNTFSGDNTYTGGNVFSDISGTLMLNQAGNSYIAQGDGVLVDSSSGDQIVISTDLTYLNNNFADAEAAYVIIGNTASLPNERAFVGGFGNTLIDEGANGDVKIDIDGSIIPVLSATNIFTGANTFSIISGTLMRNQAGNSYLVNGDGILVDSSSGDQVILSADLTYLNNNFADAEASYVIIGNTASLPNERALASGFGNTLIDEGANGDVKIDIDGSIIPVLSATQTFTGVNTFDDNINMGSNRIISASRIEIEDTFPLLRFNDPGAPTDETRWDLTGDFGNFICFATNDLNDVNLTAFFITRTGIATIDEFVVSASEFHVEHADPKIRLINTEASTSEGNWDFSSENDSFVFRAISDGGFDGGTVFTIPRNSTTPVSLDMGIDLNMNSNEIHSASVLELESTQPRIQLRDTNAPTDEEKWRIVSSGGVFAILSTSDSEGSSNDAIQITRTGIVIDKIRQLSPIIEIASADPSLRILDTSATAGEGNWEFQSIGDEFIFRAVADGLSDGGTVFTIPRNSTTPVSFDMGIDINMNSNEIHSASNIHVIDTAPSYDITDTNAGVNEKRWSMASQQAKLVFNLQNDNGGVNASVFTLIRVGTAPAGTITRGDVIISSSLIDLSGSDPQIFIRDNTAADNSGHWSFQTTLDEFRFDAVDDDDDGNPSKSRVFTVPRTGLTPDSLDVSIDIDMMDNAIHSASMMSLGTDGPQWVKGTGDPESAVAAPIGSFFSRTDGGTSTSFYVKESGTGNTGWVAK